MNKNFTKGLGSKSNWLRDFRKNRPLLLMTVPGLLVLLINSYLPMFGIVMAFQKINFDRMAFFGDWVGLKNFSFFFRTTDAFIITRNTILYNLAFIFLGLVTSVFFAISLNELTNRRASKFYQTVMFLPYFMSWIVISYIVFALLGYENGYINHSVLKALGFGPVNWYMEPKIWPHIIIMLDLWKNAGYNSVIYLAAITNIDNTYYEAAHIDGASKLQQIRYVTLQKAGEAAATAAWLAIEKGISLREIPYGELSFFLKQTGCLDEKNNTGVRFDFTDPSIPPQKIQWLTDEESIMKGLSTDKPGIAIWSSKRLGDIIRDKLLKWMNEGETENLRKHSAIALALLSEKKALPVLRNMVRERDSKVLEDCRKNNQIRGVIAIYLLGRMRDAESICELAQIICDPDEIKRPLYQIPQKIHKDNGLVVSRNTEEFNNVYFQFFTHALMALVKIGEHHLHLRQEIKDILKKAIGNGEYKSRITGAGPMTYEYSVVENTEVIVRNVLRSWEA